MRRIYTDYKVLVAIILSCILHHASAQVTSPSLLSNPWSGGLNSCQFCSIDINLDNTSDLLIFDRHGNRTLPYIRKAWGFEPAPEYAALFPELHDWVITADYNCDGKMDLFTYGLGGARVFENTSDTVLKFLLVTDMLRSFYYTGFIGILLTPVDYPAIADIDGDGDLDLLTFFGLGSFVEYHQNLSMEHFGNCDSLDFKLADHCWGNFKESGGSNRITLGVACPYKFYNTLTCAGSGDGDPPKHTGSTLLATDLNGDGLKDLLLGDVDYPGLIALTNGGTPDTANMVSQDTLFPSSDVPLRLFSFPAGSLTDVDGDGIKDLLVSPFDPNLTIPENRKSIWYYRNYGTNAQPDFRFVTDRLFLQDMLDFGSAASPVLYDLNSDGLTDLIAGNFGTYDSSWYAEGILHSGFTSRISYFKNTGTGFDFVTADLASVSSLSIQGACPAFSDITGDGFPDMITGNADGTLIFFANSGTGADPPAFLPPVMKYLNIDAGDFSAPQLFDLDKDGLSDLIIGRQAGKLSYYRNTGTATSPAFVLITDSLGLINVTDTASSVFGYSTPCFFRTQDQETRLLVGSESGTLFYFKDIDGNLAGTFTPSDSLFETAGIPSVMPAIGWRSAPAAGHVSDPVMMDVVAGNYSGGLNYFSAHSKPQVVPAVKEITPVPGFGFSIFPNPAGDWGQITLTGMQHNEELTLEVFSVSGKQVYVEKIRSEKILSLTGWADGLYVLKISGPASGTVCRRLVVIH